MANKNFDVETIQGITYRTFQGWRSLGFQVKKGEKSHYTSPKYGKMFSSRQVWNTSVNRDTAAQENSIYKDVF
jgi:hypothetical protein